MMRNLLVLTLVLGLAAMANATLLLSVNGIVDPADTEITLMQSETVVLDIHALDGQLANAPTVLGVLAGGPGSVTSVPDGVNYVVTVDGIFDLDAETAGLFGMSTAVFVDLVVPGSVYPVIDGLVADGILFHCDGIGEVTLVLVNMDTGEIYDSQVIHQIPEPMTLGLLGLGGLFLRRRK